MQLTLVVLAAGMGSRYGGLKQLAQVGPRGETLLQYNLYDAAVAGFGHGVFVIRDDLEEAFRERLLPLVPPQLEASLAFQRGDDLPTGTMAPRAPRSKPWGTGHAVWAARANVDGAFAVVNADDYYGRDALSRIAEFLRVNSPGATGEPARYGLVGYELGRTLAPSGGVSRALIEADASGRLLSLTELKGIQRDGDSGEIVCPGNNEHPSLPERALVSLNLFGFGPQLFGFMAADMARFLDHHGTDPEAEYFLPSAVDAMCAAGRATVQVLPTQSEWMGLTYAADTDRVRARIAALVEQGHYPRELPVRR